MKNLKKWIALLTTAAMVTASSYASAQPAPEYYEGGEGYPSFRGAPDSTPGLIAGAAALALIIGLCFQGNDHHHGHAH